MSAVAWEKIFDRIADILFPQLECVPLSAGGERHFVDSSVDENLEAVIIDLEARGTDKVCLKTLHDIHDKLCQAREMLGRGH